MNIPFLAKFFGGSVQNGSIPTEKPEPKRHSTGILVQDASKCPECGSSKTAKYDRAFKSITPFVMSKCCECEECGAKFDWLPKDYWEVPAVKNQLAAWRSDQ